MSNITADFDNILNWVDNGKGPKQQARKSTVNNSMMNTSVNMDNMYTVHTYHN